MSTSSRGKFRQGSNPDLLLKVTDFEGHPVDPIDITCTISGPIENVSVIETVTSGVPFQAASGYYIFTWEIADDQTAGEYTVLWEYVIDGEDITQTETVTVVENVDPSPFYSDRFIALREALGYHLSCAQNIPVYFEQSKISRDNKKFELTFANWNQSPGVKIYRNKDIISSGYSVDYFNGNVTFDNTLLDQDVVNADYNFQWFSEDDLTRFLANAIQTVNLYPPVSNYGLENFPNRYLPIVLYGAAKDALRQLMMCLNFQQPAQVFGGVEEAQRAFQNFETLKKNYEGDWEKLLEQKKYGPYPVSNLIVTPEYTLPGGRCLSPETEVLCIVNEGFGNCNINNVYTRTVNSNTAICDVEIKVYTLQNIYDLFRRGFNIEILSHSDITGNLIFAPINYIWESGFKDVYELKTFNGHSVRASDEHLFYVNGKYIPLMDIEIGDELITSDNHSIETSRVKSIKKLKRKEVMLDLEVYGTANLFANGIKCHNSRWFRYLFK